MSKKVARKLRTSMAFLLALVMMISMASPAAVYAAELGSDDSQQTSAVTENGESTEAVPEAEESTEAVPEEESSEIALLDSEEETQTAIDVYAGVPVFTEDDVESIQAYTAPNFYGQRLSKIEVTFKNGTNMTGAALASSYTVWDRAFRTNPGAFETGTVKEVRVDGYKVTLAFDDGPAGNDAFGMLCTTTWAIANVYDGSGNITGYEVKTGDSQFQYFTRENLDLVLGVGTAPDLASSLALTDSFGHYLENGVWKETVNQTYDDYQFATLDVAVAPTKYRNFDGEVPVYYYVPDSYSSSKAMSMVLYITGQGTSYWERYDGDNFLACNLGTNITYDNSTASWVDLAKDSNPNNDVIVVSPHVYSSANNDAAQEVAGVIEYFKSNYNIDQVILVGNSNGTGISGSTIRQYPDLVDAFVCNNGWIGNGPNQTTLTWTAEEKQAVAESGVAIWALSGEQDHAGGGANPRYIVQSLNDILPYYKAAGWSDEWIAQNIRFSCYKSWQFLQWGVSDHSCIKVTSWNYITQPYLNVYEDSGKLAVGSVYHMSAAQDSSVKEYNFVTYPESVSEWVLSSKAETQEARQADDLDAVTSLATDYSEACQLPLTGYFTKAIGTDRSVKVYISENASIRSYFTVVAVPDGVDTAAFIEEQGWFALADEKGEGLFVLEPGAGGWGSAAQESTYVTAAMNFLRTPSNANRVTVFSTYGEFYLAGYGEGAAPLEAWAADFPIFVISQAYIGGQSVGQSYLDSVGAKTYDGTNTSGYDPEIKDFDNVLAGMGYSRQIRRSEVPVPTWFVGYNGSDYSISYWKKANDVIATATPGLYRQDINSGAWQTDYANKCIRKENPNAQYGISQVKLTDNQSVKAQDIYGFLSIFTRYDNTFAYSNALGYRLDYTAATVQAQEAAAAVKNAASYETLTYKKTGGAIGMVELWSQADVSVKAYEASKGGTIVVGVMAFADNNRDSKFDPREYLLYIPDSAAAKWGNEGAPVLVLYAGMSQTDRIFLDSTQWWKVADDNGFVVAITCEQYSAATAVNHADNDLFYYSMIALLEQNISRDYVKIDSSRIYGSGQSAGSRVTQGFARTNPEFYAAVASSSFSDTTTGSGKMIPAYLVCGQSDIANLLPDLWSSNTLKTWIEYLFEANGLDTDRDSYTSSNLTQRFKTYTWENYQDIPLVQYTQTLARAHNCYPEEMVMMWDFLEHHRFEKDDNGYVTARYYSASGFTADDAQLIEIEEPGDPTDPTDPVEKDLVKDFVTRLYETVLGRKPDASGRDSWVSALKNKTKTGAEVAYGFLFSTEYLNKKVSDSQYLETLYRALMGRASDAAGKADWQNHLNMNFSRGYIFSQFISSKEFTELCKQYEILPGSYTSSYVLDKNPAATKYVYRLYTKVLERRPDVKGQEYWVNGMLSGQIAAGQAAKGFLYSTEFTGKQLGNTRFLVVLYTALFDRSPDLEGFAHWTLRMGSGMTREQVVEGFIASAEFGDLCKKLGVSR